MPDILEHGYRDDRFNRMIMRAYFAPVGWRIFWMLVASAMIVYFQQKTLMVAAARIMPDLSLSQMQIGWLQWAFVVSYACLQLPGGIAGQRFGARRTLFVTGLLAVAAAAAMPIAPSVLTGTGLFVALVMAQLVMGAAHAPFFPVSSGVMEEWLPRRRWGFAQGVQITGCQIGAALSPPVIVLLTQRLGWQSALLWIAIPPLALVLVWRWYMRDRPAEHPSISPDELMELASDVNKPITRNIRGRDIVTLIRDRSIFLLTSSYICMNYVFFLLSTWCFLYLIKERHFTLLQSGWLASLPPLGAALGAGFGGALVDRLCRKFGLRWGCRLTPLTALPAAGVLLLIVVFSRNSIVAVAALVLCFMCVELTEGSYWATAMTVGRSNTMAAAGVVNTGGNIGGVVGIPIVAYLSAHQSWSGAFLLGTLLSILAAAAWLGIDAGRSVDEVRQ
jgi:ACS family glucarate transporter-like MFS transporter